MMRYMVTAANPRTLTEFEENVTQLHAVLSQKDLGTFPQQAKEKPAAKVRMAKRGYQGPGRRGQGDQPGPKTYDTTNTLCWDCGETGHMRTRCPHHFRYQPKWKFDRDGRLQDQEEEDQPQRENQADHVAETAKPQREERRQGNNGGSR